ncbi:MAG TPA: hypothetical protein VFZ70_05745 [Euzebyales bacterium]
MKGPRPAAGTATAPLNGVLTVRLARSRSLLGEILEVVRTWLRRRPTLATSLRMGDATPTLGGAGSHTERDRSIETWIDRALAP